MKRFLSIISVLLLAVCIAFPAAAEEEYLVKTEQDGDYIKSNVVDMADLLTDSEEKILLDKIEDIKEEYDYEIVIVTAPSIGGRSIMAYADDFYDYNNYGCGAENDGMLFVIDMDEREYWTSTTGYGITAFTDYGIDKLYEAILPDLKDGNYFDAFDIYLDKAEEFLIKAESGSAYDTNNEYRDSVYVIKRELIILAVAAAVAGVAVMFMCFKMNTAVKQNRAANYVVNNSFRLLGQNDMYLYSNVSKTKISSSSGGGSSTHVGSSGTHHGGGGGRF